MQAVAVVFENVNLRLESEIKINGAGCRVTRYTKKANYTEQGESRNHACFCNFGEHILVTSVFTRRVYSYAV